MTEPCFRGMLLPIYCMSCGLSQIVQVCGAPFVHKCLVAGILLQDMLNSSFMHIRSHRLPLPGSLACCPRTACGSAWNVPLMIRLQAPEPISVKHVKRGCYTVLLLVTTFLVQSSAPYEPELSSTPPTHWDPDHTYLYLGFGDMYVSGSVFLIGTYIYTPNWPEFEVCMYLQPTCILGWGSYHLEKPAY